MSLEPATVGAIVPAAGRGERFRGATPKALVPIRGRPLVQHALEAIHRVDEVVAIVVVGPAHVLDAMRELVAAARLDKVTAVIAGGADRQASVARGLEALPAAADLVLIHDGARPCVTPGLVRAVVAAAATAGAATAAVPIEDTVKRGEDGWVTSTLDRTQLYRVQTPQAFHRAVLERAHREALRSGFHGTDDAALVEQLGHPVRLVAGDAGNLKVTVPEDLAVAEALLGRGGGPADAVRVEQHAEAPAVDAAVVRDGDEIGRALLEQRADQVVRDSVQAESADRERRSARDVGDRFRARSDDFVHTSATSPTHAVRKPVLSLSKEQGGPKLPDGRGDIHPLCR